MWRDLDGRDVDIGRRFLLAAILCCFSRITGSQKRKKVAICTLGLLYVATL